MMFERNFENCSVDLADKIIKQSYNIEQKQNFFKNICSIFTLFHMPKPQFILPLLLVIGFFIGSIDFTSTEYYQFMDNLYLEGDFNE